MKKLFFVFFGILFLVGCTKEPIPTPEVNVSNDLKISAVSGIKLQSSFVSSEVSMNVKAETAQKVTIKIYDIANKVVSKETTDIQAGDNILKVYTSALPSSAYRIALYDSNNNLLGITDFNKI